MNLTVMQGDCLKLMQRIPDQSIDACITDPPYGTTACKWDSVIPFEPMWSELKRIVKPNGAIVLFASQPFTSLLVASNIECFRYEWIWRKSNGGGFLNANRHPLKRHENILVFSQKASLYFPQKSKGKPYLIRSAGAGGTTFDQSVAGWVTENNGDRFPVSVLPFANDTGLHPTQKPVDLLRYLVRTYTNTGDTVLDFTTGSGTTGVACAIEGRNFIGIEREKQYVKIARSRIAEALEERRAA